MVINSRYMLLDQRQSLEYAVVVEALDNIDKSEVDVKFVSTYFAYSILVSPKYKPSRLKHRSFGKSTELTSFLSSMTTVSLRTVSNTQSRRKWVKAYPK